MMTRGLVYVVAVMLCGGAGWAWAGWEYTHITLYGLGAGNGYTSGNEGNNTFIGFNAGYSNATGVNNTFVGDYAGYNATGNGNTSVGVVSCGGTGNSNSCLGSLAGAASTTGSFNTFLGYTAGNLNTEGVRNSFLGCEAGYGNTTGSGNVFIGYQAGYYNQTGSNKLYIDSYNASTPLIYGEFDNRRLTVNGNLEVIGPENGLVRLSNVTTDTTNKAARMVLRHYNNAQKPVYLFGAASTLNANFVAFGGGATIGNAATQIDLFTAPTTTTQAGTPRLTIIGNGYVGIGTQTPWAPLQMAGGAYTNGTGWFNASSRAYKEEIEVLGSGEAMAAFQELKPVKFAYKSDKTDRHVGFVAEEVPELVATKDRKGLSPMDIVAVLTKVVQELKAENEGLKAKNESLENRLLIIEEKIAASK